MVVVQGIAFVVSAAFLLLMLGLATMAFRGGERRGYHETATAIDPPGGVMMIRRTKVSVVNQVFVWGLALTLVAAMVVMVVATFIFDSWAWP